MFRNLKVLGLALVSLVAMSAMASSASAATFTSNAHTLTNLGVQVTPIVLTVGGQPVSCKVTTFHSHESEATEEASKTVKSHYTECTALSEAVSAKVTGFGQFGEASTCDYLLHASGTADLVCQVGAEVTIDAGTCTIHIPAQEGIGTIDYSNVAGGDIEVRLTINNIKGTQTDGFLCPFNGSGGFTNGALSGKFLLGGLNSEGNNVNITHDA